MQGAAMVSSSTVNKWLLVLPLFWMLVRPRNCPGNAPEKFVLGATTKAMPWALRSVYTDKIANTKDVENVRPSPLGQVGPGRTWAKKVDYEHLDRGVGNTAVSQESRS